MNSYLPVHEYSSYIAKENERRSALGLEEDESQVELEDNEELTQLGMVTFTSQLTNSVSKYYTRVRSSFATKV